MYELLFITLGIIIGSIITTILSRRDAGYGFFKIEKIQDEEDIYAVNMRLVPDQFLNKKKRIILTRE